MPKQLQRLDHCLNCGAPVGSNYCPDCGQENEDRTVALKPLLSDFLSEIASFDSKLARTIPPLLFRPGFLTNAYNEGKRVRFLSPLKMYIVASVAFFLIIPYTAPIGRQSGLTGDSRSGRPATLSDLSTSGAKTGSISTDRRRKASEPDIATAVRTGPMGISVNPAKLPATEAEYDAWLKDPANRRRQSRWDEFIARRVMRVKSDPSAFGQRMYDHLPKMMFLLLPIFAVLLKLIYLRSRRLYVEHLIFALHCHAFVFIAFGIAEVIPSGGIALLLALLWATAYLFVAMRRVYRQSVLKTLLKYSILSVSYLLILSFSLLGVVFLTFATS